MGKKYAFIIVGSGAGGATLARELSQKGKEVLVVERGQYETKIGTPKDALRYYDVHRWTQTPVTSKEGTILWRTFMAGGTTMVSCGNAVRCLETELNEYGIFLEQEFLELETETATAPIDPQLLSEGSACLIEAAQALGYPMNPMPKFINPDRCVRCGLCTLGCAHGAKWTALRYLEEAQQNGAEILYDTQVQEVWIENGRAKGIKGVNKEGAVTLEADVVILAAGGLGTPVILQQSGIKEAGEGLFIDLMVNTYGVTDGLNQLHEPTMALVNHQFHKEKGFILSTYINQARLARFMEAGLTGMMLPPQKLLGLMVKTTDDPAGRVYPDGSVSKPVTDDDQKRLDAGIAIAKEILIKTGAAPDSIVISKPEGAHPGGTAAIGKIVDRDLQSKVDNLFVCDGSVLPKAPGLPPILTIAALAKRLSKTLVA